MFYKILNPDKLDDLIQSSTAESLALINILTKISNSPILLKATADNVKNKKKNGSVDPVKRGAVDDALNLLPAKANVADMSLSGKSLSWTQRYATHIHLPTSRKTVIPRYNAQNNTPGKMKMMKSTSQMLIILSRTQAKNVFLFLTTHQLSIF